MWPLRLRKEIKKSFGHRKEYYWNAVFRRLSPTRFCRFLEELGVRPGMVVLVHSSLGEFGYIEGGPQRIIESLAEVVGSEGTIVMPSFPFHGSMQAYIESRPECDLRIMPSRSGRLTETFRVFPGTLRSTHPSAPVCARGKHAPDIVSGHEQTDTPCGPESPFGRMARMEAWVLRLGIGVLSSWHFIQESLDYPNLFLPEPVKIPCVDQKGRSVVVKTRVYRRKLPNAFFLGEDAGDQLMSVRGSAFPLLYSGSNERAYRRDPRRQAVLGKMLEIRDQFVAQGLLRMGDLNGGRCELFPMRPYLEYAFREVRRLIDAYRHRYDLGALERMLQAGEFPP